MYIIQEKGKIILADENLQRLEDTLKFMPKYDKTNIEEVSEASIVKAYDGNLYLSGYEPQEPEPTKEEQQKAREEAYKAEIDPITCHINRLKDEEQTPEVIAEIAALVEERKAKVAEIKARYPYQIEKSNNSDSVLSEAPENKGQSENDSKEVI